MLRKSLIQHGLTAVVALTFIGCKKTVPTGQAAVQAPRSSVPANTDSQTDADGSQSKPGTDTGERRIKPTYDLLTALREHPFNSLTSTFDLGLSDAEIDDIASKPERQTIPVASADGNLMLTVEDGELVDVELVTGATGRPTDDEP